MALEQYGEEIERHRLQNDGMPPDEVQPPREPCAIQRLRQRATAARSTKRERKQTKSASSAAAPAYTATAPFVALQDVPSRLGRRWSTLATRSTSTSRRSAGRLRSTRPGTSATRRALRSIGPLWRRRERRKSASGRAAAGRNHEQGARAHAASARCVTRRLRTRSIEPVGHVAGDGEKPKAGTNCARPT